MKYSLFTSADNPILQYLQNLRIWQMVTVIMQPNIEICITLANDLKVLDRRAVEFKLIKKSVKTITEHETKGVFNKCIL